jgi:protoporphyrinogen/coproporphyrinogen III oxidase
VLGELDRDHREVTIVGAGIAGMLAAYVLDKSGYRVTLCEENERAGGLIRTTQTQYGIAESAAHSLIATEAVIELCRDLRVELISPRKEAKAKYIVRDEKLRRFPLGPFETLQTLGRAAFARANGSNGRDNLDAWGRKHLGQPALEYLLTPFVRGIYGVQPMELGVATAFPSLVVPSGKSLLGAMLTKRRNGSKAKEKGTRMAPRFGMGDLTGRLERHLEKRLGGRFRKGECVPTLPDAPNVILATPAYAAGSLLVTEANELAQLLRAVRYTPIVSVTAFVDSRALNSKTSSGVGALVPATEQRSSLGILFNSGSFANRVADEKYLASLTIMMGGTSQPDWITASEEEIERAVQTELAELLGISEAPRALIIHRWPHALPQYSVDLPAVWQAAGETWCRTPGQMLFGNYTGQISLRGMIESAMTLVHMA